MKKYSTLNLFLRSTIFFIYSTLSIIVYSILLSFSFLLPLRYRYVLIRGFLKAYMYMFEKICDIHFKIEGLENIPKDTTAVVLSKHQSAWETFYLPILFRDPAFIAKRELFWVPFFGWGFAASSPITINRKNKTSAMQQIIKKGTQALDNGRFVVVFPEGTRIAVGQVGQYRLGGTRLAVATNHPVIPVAHNAGKHWPKRGFIKRPGTIHLVIGPAIETKGRTPEDVLEETKTWIENTVALIH